MKAEDNERLKRAFEDAARNGIPLFNALLDFKDASKSNDDLGYPVHLDHLDLRCADFRLPEGSTWSWCNFDFSYCDLRGANLSGALFEYCSFKGANLENAKIIGDEIRMKDDSPENIKHSLDLKYPDFSDYCTFEYANMQGVDLSFTVISSTNMIGADLRNANLTYTQFNYSELSNANITGTFESLKKDVRPIFHKTNMYDCNMTVKEKNLARRCGASFKSRPDAGIIKETVTKQHYGNYSESNKKERAI